MLVIIYIKKKFIKNGEIYFVDFYFTIPRYNGKSHTW